MVPHSPRQEAYTNHTKWRRLEEKAAIMVMAFVAVLVSLILIVVLGVITWNAIPGLSFDYLLTSEADAEEFGGGIAQAILGTLLLSLCSVVLASPLGVGTAIYLSRYARPGPLVDVLRFFIDVLSGTPSVVLGIFGLLFLVVYLKPLTGGFSLLSGSIALAILVIPLIERSTEEAIKTVPGAWRRRASLWHDEDGHYYPYYVAVCDERHRNGHRAGRWPRC